jgi:hypothetical protein
MELEDRIELLVEQWSLDEVFEFLDITPQQAILILYEGGHIDLPEWLLNREEDNEQDL